MIEMRAPESARERAIREGNIPAGLAAGLRDDQVMLLAKKGIFK